MKSTRCINDNYVCLFALCRVYSIKYYGCGICACRLLYNTDDRIIDVAAQVGYRDPAAFQEAFRATQGLSPRAFRKTMRG